MDTEIKLFESKAECCGCGACRNICPNDAIYFENDEHGYIYPRIQKDKCVSCGLCNTVCPIKKDAVINTPIKAYAVALNDCSTLKKSASGGAFAGIAKYILDQNGVVYGAAYGENQYVHHICISSNNDLGKLQDSKYVQSDIEKTYKDVKEKLREGKLVLFSGTPCQIAGLKLFLRRDYDSLYTIDLICHGVPSFQLFHDGIYSYINDGEKILELSFRDKASGWGTEGYILTDKRRYVFNELKSSYYYYFTDSSLNRDSCYGCKYSSDKRPGDFTIGDYWHIGTAHPSFEKTIIEKNGVSCVLINTKKGIDLFTEVKKYFSTIESTLDLVKERNGRLREDNSTTLPEKRKVLLNLYRTNGYSSIDDYWKKYEKHKLLKLKVKEIIRPIYKLSTKIVKGFSVRK